jgi:GNAT superfamily N-acetyltransferase
MIPSVIQYKETRDISLESVVNLYKANGWSSADKPVQLHQGLRASHALVSAWDGDRLIGIGNTLSDGCLVVYYSHLLVDPKYHRRGIGTRLMMMLMEKYAEFHQHILVADRNAVEFYKHCGFKRAGNTEPMWIYGGTDH